MKPDDLLSDSQQPATGPCSESNEFSPHLTAYFFAFVFHIINNYVEQNPSWEANSRSANYKFPPFMEREVSLPFSQYHATVFCPEPVESNPHPHTVTFHLRLGLPSGLSSSGLLLHKCNLILINDISSVNIHIKIQANSVKRTYIIGALFSCLTIMS